MWTIVHTEASLGWGGQEIRILRESLGMKERGHRVIIIAQDDSVLLERARKSGIETVAVSFRKKDYPGTLLGLLRLIKEERPGFINTHSSRDSWLGSIAARLSRQRPFVIRSRHISTPVAANFTSSLLYRNLPDRIITTAEAIKERLVEVNGVPAGKIVSIPTGIDTRLFDPEGKEGRLRAELSLPESTPLVGIVSVLRSWKGHEYFIEAAEIVSRELKEARFVIVGDGPRKEALRKTIDEKGLGRTVLMLGHRDDVVEILASLDVLVQSSYANEGVPQSVIQALAMEVPVVATDLKPFMELVRDGETGLVAPAKDARVLAEGIMKLLRDRGLGKRLGKKGRALVLSRFSLEHMLDSTEALYRELMDSRARSTAGMAR